MGRRKVSNKPVGNNRSKNNSKVKQSSKKTIGSDMLGGILIVLGFIFLVFFTFENIGSFAELVTNIFFGLFGKIAFVFPLVLIILGGHLIISETKLKVSKELRKGIIVMLILSSVVYSFASSDFDITTNPMKFFVDSFNYGVDGENIAGLIGALIASILVKFTGIIVTRIILLFVTLISILLAFDISFRQLFFAIYNVFAFMYNSILVLCATLFRKDGEEDEDDYESLGKDLENKFKEPKLSKRELATLNKKKYEDEEKLKEKGSTTASENVRLSANDQIEFDINKLGGKLSDAELQGKQKRDEFFKLQKEQKEDKNIKEVLTLDHTKHVEQDNYEFPPIELLNMPKGGEQFDKKAIHATAVKLQKTLASFGVEAKVTNITRGPTVTRYELTPNTGVKVSKIVNLADDIALNLAAKSIRIEAPIPGRAAVGIEVPNTTPVSVFLREVIESDTFKDHKSKLAFALGKDAAGEIVVGDIAKMPHVLIAGATGSGKSVCINSLIVSILYKSKPSEVKMILIDPKMVELSGYNGIPHLLIPVVTEPKKAAGALNWAVQEMVNRYTLFASKGVKDIKSYNNTMEKEEGAKLPQIVIIVDELADLMMVAPNDVEDAICRLAQMARAAGMHLVIATQRPSVDVITGIIKANIPSRIACTVSSQVDSRTILDMAGAEKLLGKGDMLYFPVGETKPLRVQGNFISEEEIEQIVEDIKSNIDVTYNDEIIKSIDNANIRGKGERAKPNDSEDVPDDEDEILTDAIDLVVDMGQASASMLQRRFKIGYARAGRLVDQMEERGIVSGYEGSKPRQVLISKSEWQELKFGSNVDSDNYSDDENNDSEGANVDNFGGNTNSIVDIEL